MQKVKEIVIMGGAFEHYGNVTLSAEYNIYVDPEAVHEVLQLGVTVTFVPLDVTEQVSHRYQHSLITESGIYE